MRVCARAREKESEKTLSCLTVERVVLCLQATGNGFGHILLLHALNTEILETESETEKERVRVKEREEEWDENIKQKQK